MHHWHRRSVRYHSLVMLVTAVIRNRDSEVPLLRIRLREPLFYLRQEGENRQRWVVEEETLALGLNKSSRLPPLLICATGRVRDF